MPGQRSKVLGHVVGDLLSRMSRTKVLPPDDQALDTPLNRCLNTFDITLLGIGHMVGAGVFVLAGTVARDIAGPGIVLSFFLAGLTSLLAALCYAELGTKVPRAGSAYVYTYCSIGEFWAFIIGWNIILEHMIGAASVARAWSGYVDSLFNGYISNETIAWIGQMDVALLGHYPDVLAFFVCLSYASLLGIGVKTSAVINSIFTMVTLMVMVVVIVVGFYFADFANWTSGGGFLPYGFTGVVAGAATCFYAFVGFDSIATCGEEAKNPAFSIPLATILSMGVVTLGYVLVGAALTLMVPYKNIDRDAALPQAFANQNLPWLKYVVTVGALCGMTTTLFGSLFALPRCMYAMATDGLIFNFLGNVNEKTQIPLANLAVSAVCSAIIALLFDLQKLVEFMSIGTLLAYTIVSASVIILRYRPDPSNTLIAPDSTPTTPNEPNAEITSASTSSINSDMDGPMVGRLKPDYYWLSSLTAGCTPGSAVSSAVLIFTVVSAVTCSHAYFSFEDLKGGQWWAVALVFILFLILFICLGIIYAHEQNEPVRGKFRVPFVPVLPALSIFFNVSLMMNLSSLTWVRFLVWMTLGLLVYFLYGMRHSKEGEFPSSYTVLMTSSEASKGDKWGTMLKEKEHSNTVIRIKAKGKISDDKSSLINEEDD